MVDILACGSKRAAVTHFHFKAFVIKSFTVLRLKASYHPASLCLPTSLNLYLIFYNSKAALQELEKLESKNTNLLLAAVDLPFLLSRQGKHGLSVLVGKIQFILQGKDESVTEPIVKSLGEQTQDFIQKIKQKSWTALPYI